MPDEKSVKTNLIFWNVAKNVRYKTRRISPEWSWIMARTPGVMVKLDDSVRKITAEKHVSRLSKKKE